jgi:hypothetical protein
MTDRNMTAEEAQRFISSIVDERVTDVMNKLHEAAQNTPELKGLAAPAVTGAMVALVRFDIQHRTVAGEVVTVRAILADLLPLLNRAAELLLDKPNLLAQ